MAEAQPTRTSDIIQASNSSIIPEQVIRETIAQVEGTSGPINQDVGQQQQVTSCEILSTLKDFLARFSRFEQQAEIVRRCYLRMRSTSEYQFCELHIRL